MKHLKKISALVLALMMVLAMGTSVFAATNAAEPDVVGDATNAEFEVTTGTTSFNIPKGIIVTNEEQIKVYGPKVNYTFEVSNAEVATGTKITSTVANHEGTVTVRPGVTGGLVIATQPSFDGAETGTVLGENGKELKSNLSLTVNPAAFAATGAGVYRYKIEDKTAKATLDAAGITRETDYNAVRFVDLYIRNTQSGELELYGYTVLNTNEKDINGDTNDTTVKNPGFVSGATVDNNDNITEAGTIKADRYDTINVTLEKEVQGALGDKTHLFPFSAVVNNNGANNHDFYTTTDTTANVQGDDAAEATISQTLKHGDKLLVKGLNPKATVAYTETNDTPDTYEVTANVALTYSVDSSVETSETAATAALKVSNYADSDTQGITKDATNSAVKYTNTLNEISPTNVVMRFAPYLFILGGAMLLLVASRRRKAEQE